MLHPHLHLPPRPTTASCAVATLLLCSLAVTLAGCKDFTPQVGAQCAERDASADGTIAGYGSYLVTGVPCGDSGVSADAGTNSLVAEAGVTGSVLIADQLNNRVIILDRAGNLLWHFGNGDSVPGPASVVAPNDAEFLPTNEVLIVGTGTAAGGGPDCPSDGGACPDDRVIIVDYATRGIAWSYGGHGDDPGQNQLSAPTTARLVAGNHVLISDQGNARVVEIDRVTRDVVWQYPAADAGACATAITPQSAERLANGNTLIADQSGNRVLEVTPAGCPAWTFGAGLNFPSAASRLPNGNTLIADTNNYRALEVTSAGATVWSFTTPSATAVTGAVRLAGGDTLVTEINEDLVVEVDDSSPPAIFYTHGQAGVGGALPGELNQPYNAKVVGDYTGISAPPADAGAEQ